MVSPRDSSVWRVVTPDQEEGPASSSAKSEIQIMEQEAIVSFQSQNKSTATRVLAFSGQCPRSQSRCGIALARSSQPRVSLLLPPWWFSRCFLLLRGALSLWLVARPIGLA
eukprot:COSAG06_NODE_2911_length_6102_cov_2.217724_2_plen_111_part_00